MKEIIENVKSSLRGFVKNKYISKSDAEDVVSKVKKTVSKEKKRIVKLVLKEKAKLLKEIGIVSASEGKLLKKRIKKLQEKLKEKAARTAGKFRR